MKKPGGRGTKAAATPAATTEKKPSGGSGFLTAKSADFADPAPVPIPGQSDIRKESNPFTDKDPRMLVYAYTGFLLRILLVFGAVFSILQYVNARDEKRIERTMELIDMWDRPEFQEAQRALRTRLTKLTDENKGLLGTNPTEQQRRVFAEAIGRQMLTAEGGTQPLEAFQQDFDRIVYFLNRLATCVKGNICDRGVAHDYFMDYAQSFWTYFAGYAKDVRKTGTVNFARPIEEYVASEPQPAKAP